MACSPQWKSQSHDRNKIATSRRNIQTSDWQVPEGEGISIQGPGCVFRRSQRRWTFLHRIEHEQLPRGADREDLKRAEYRFLIVAEKFQTGFNKPLLHTMYVDKNLAGAHLVQVPFEIPTKEW